MIIKSKISIMANEQNKNVLFVQQIEQHSYLYDIKRLLVTPEQTKKKRKRS